MNGVIAVLNGRRTLGLFISGIQGSFRRDLCEALNILGKQHGYDLLYFHLIGQIGADCKDFGIKEDSILDVIPFDKLDGILFDNNNVYIDEIRRKIHDRLLECSCPIISIGEPGEDLFEIHFDNCNAIKEFVHHFVSVHGFTKIGYMSGIKDQPDAEERLAAFREAMREHGLPDDGAGIFYGDFWYNKGKEAADFFINQCPDRPEAIICANDYMAISLCDELMKMGINIPGDICISGYDDIDETRTHYPTITTTSQNKMVLAEKIFKVFESSDGKQLPHKIIRIPTTNIYRVSSGCTVVDENTSPDDKNNEFHRNIRMLYSLYDAEAAMLEMTGLTEIGHLEAAFEKRSINFGSYQKFFLFTYTDENNRHSYERAFDHTTDKVYPAVWIDRNGTSVRPEGNLSVSDFLPQTTDDSPQIYYITHIHFGDHRFGYTAVMMDDIKTFNEFYTIWTLNISVALETLMQRNSIRSLVADLETESTHDRLTGLLNRIGFEKSIRRSFDKAKNNGDTIMTAVMIDMDRLKYINDVFGHAEGDVAINAMGNIIKSSSDESVISGRTGGDEFYAVMFGRDEAYAESFVNTLRRRINEFNSTSGKKYSLDASCGIFSGKLSGTKDPEDILRCADERMYAEKRQKHAERS